MSDLKFSTTFATINVTRIIMEMDLDELRMVEDAVAERREKFDLSLTTEERKLAVGNFRDKISAIKSYRSRVFTGLKEAKDKIEAYRIEQGLPAKCKD